MRRNEDHNLPHDTMKLAIKAELGKMKSFFRLGLGLAMVVSVYPAAASASRCTSEHMQKMAHGGLSQQEITHICDTASPAALSPEEATEILKATSRLEQCLNQLLEADNSQSPPAP